MHVELLVENGQNSSFYARVLVTDMDDNLIHIKYASHRGNKLITIRESIKREDIIRARVLS